MGVREGGRAVEESVRLPSMAAMEHEPDQNLALQSLRNGRRA